VKTHVARVFQKLDLHDRAGSRPRLRDRAHRPRRATNAGRRRCRREALQLVPTARRTRSPSLLERARPSARWERDRVLRTRGPTGLNE
jgi:hypothetical protein